MESSIKKILIFGAGKIGRSFIGQIFSRAGYKVVFVDISNEIIDALNRENRYKVVVKSEEGDKTIEIKNVSGIHASKIAEIIHEMTITDLMALSVGKNGLFHIIPLLAGGLKERRLIFPDKPLNIIIAENMRDADLYFKAELGKHLPPDFPLNSYVGLIETSIGKMVPIMSENDVRENILTVFAEPYNELILDKKGFRSEIPDVADLQMKENIKAWVDRKLFIHNFGHVSAAYYGFYNFPDTRYIYEVLDKPRLRNFVREAMQQSAEILLALYPDEFTKEQLKNHIEDLINRFRNRALGDTLYRVGRDLYRKFQRDDRLIMPYITGIKKGLPVDKITEAICYSFFFRATDENGRMLSSDENFIQLIKEKGINYILKNVCRLNKHEMVQIQKKFSNLNLEDTKK